ncbi:MAG TPA: glycosyltransferase [Miltoncostaeaceae bacterium]|nr:glycosyltransferase [Miltoncostaeaceae bacterium]
MTGFDVVIPTLGRESLAALLAALAAGPGPAPGRIVLVDDRADGPPLDLAPLGPLAPRAEVVPGGGRGPAAARNAGWRRCTATWVAFLDDDVVPGVGWRAALAADLAACPPEVAATQGRVHVPLPAHRRPTDRERSVAALADAPDVTADMAYRRDVLAAVGGFDERFPRAYREDTDLALRVRAAGWVIARGGRAVAHPVRPAPWWASVRAQAGNADDMLMRALHGRRWRRGQPVRGRRPLHVAQTAAGLVFLVALATRRRRVARPAAALWAAGWAEFTWHRARRGPAAAGEVLTMAATSALIPPAATWHSIRGTVRARRLTRTARTSEASAIGGAPPAHVRRVVPEQPPAELPVGPPVPDVGEVL